MAPTIPGIHHVTAITAVPQENLDFYCGVLGLRLVKLTVNFDDPESYHLYYGDETGSPGTILTFFAWPGAPRGTIGPPQVSTTAFAAPEGSLGYWEERLHEHLVSARPGPGHFGERALELADPDGLRLAIVEVPEPRGQAPTAGPVPPEHALRGFHSVTLSEEGYERTARLLTEVMGFQAEGGEGNRFRHRAGEGGAASIVDLLCEPDRRRGRLGAGVVHHVAFRTPDDEQQQAWRARLAEAGRDVTPVMDRNYFRSVYFREPGGVLFEIATDPPGFTRDEPLEELGAGLRLPEWLEPRRAELERSLPQLRLPKWYSAA